MGEVIEDARRGALKPRLRGAPGQAADRRAHPARHLRGQGLPADHPAAVHARLPLRLRFLRRDAATSTASTICAPSTRRWPRSRRQERRLLFFVDDNIASEPRALKELCRALIPMRVNWVSQASLDVTSDSRS